MIARRLSASLVTLTLCVVLGACASYEKPLAPELFPAQVAAAADPTPIVLAVTDRELRYRSARQSGHSWKSRCRSAESWRPRARLPLEPSSNA